MTTLDLLAFAVEQRPDQIAVAASTALTYRELAEASDRIAYGLLASGLARGQRVGLAFSNRDAPDHAAAWFGVQKAAGVAVPLDASAPAPELAARLGHSGARFVLASDAPPVDAVGDRLLRLGDACPRPLPEVGGADLAEIIYTSGTTGRPRGVAVPHRNAVGTWAKDAGPLAGGAFVNPVPLSAYAGSAFLIGCIKNGLTNRVLARFEPEAFVAALADADVVSVYGVAPMWVRVLKDVPALETLDLSHIRVVSFGAAAMPPWAVSRLGALFSRALIQNIYGLTEGGPAICRLRPGDHRTRPGSVGRPSGGTQVRIAEDGEILLRSPGIPARSLWRDPEGTRRIVDDDGWIRTGDVGRLDDDGFLYVTDRKRDLVITGGSNVAPAEVEAALLLHPAVREAAVIGLPDEVRGEIVAAYVVAKAPVDGEALRAFVGERLAAWKVPRVVRIVPTLPRNAMGKVVKGRLRMEVAGAQ